jgi:rhodanese-related sulfurtransferase
MNAVNPHSLARAMRITRLLLALLGLLMVARTLAQPAADPGETALPTALTTCRAPDNAPVAVQTSPAWPTAQGALKRNTTCWITPADLQKRLEQPSAAGSAPPYLIDVRRHGFRNEPIPNALHMRLRELQDNAFLSREPLVLIGTGLDVAELQATCEHLRPLGFDRLKILQGGANAWLAHRRALAQAITPAQWVSTFNQGIHWHLVLEAPLPQTQQERLPLAPSLTLQTTRARDSAQATAGALLQQQQRIQETSDPATQTAVAFMATQDAAAGVLHALHQLQRQSQDGHHTQTEVPIYVIEGGWSGYQSFIEQNHAIHVTARHQLARACGAL